MGDEWTASYTHFAGGSGVRIIHEFAHRLGAAERHRDLRSAVQRALAPLP
ncbi:hypothetical protein BKA04_000237 [Cryobacterium mesophilum]|nr:hypothetical protein [Terrimesophilobacter mesophilus]